MRRSERRNERTTHDHVESPDPDERELAALRARVDLEDRLQRALETVDDELEVLDLVEQALAERFGDTTRLIVPDPARLRLGSGRVVDPDATLLDVDTCGGFRRGEPLVTLSSRRFDACAHLRDADPPCSAVCVPLAANGELVGVVHWSGPEDQPLTPTEVATIASIAHLGACHVLLRRASTAEPPRTDPLTGLLNPRSIERAILGLVTDLVPFSVAVCAFDDFDGYNERHGHHVGDRAVRLFARAITTAVRPDDIVGRSDLDQFTAVFPSTSALDAAHALERVREALVLTLSDGEVPTFSASFGVADSNQGESIEAIVETAGLAAQLAHAAGSNRVVVAGEETSGAVDADDG